MFFAIVLTVAQAAAPAPPLRAADIDGIGPRILLAKGGVRVLESLAVSREVPLEDVFIRDDVLTSMARTIAKDARLAYVPTVYTVPAWRDLYVVTAESFAAYRTMDIFVSPLLLEYQDTMGRRGMLAHELAHPRTVCSGGDGHESMDACERDVDLLAATWVGKEASIRGLCQLMAGAWHWRYTTDASSIIERIKNLHFADIPR